ncbi:MAG TPA: RNA polymerase sigma factor SigZ [Methylomusa anaerophila]|uniref:RNA polymerase sigma factor SigZ n=1 Tax=Methylomusa anaerophila TaxID=1930071 RepID=A0A348AG55_9FIRM|nr:RNA polymerase sigma factor SigZ [Methylomusa anaerophila]BBB90053.1 RNA polymerase sigma factor SigM [Methylomusa anaerophila]HML88220.1 RNA polymerase sigma factor SigZ [Methylomusa anaerophila]
MKADMNEFWQEFSVPLKNFIRKRIANEQDTEDILQEVFSRVYNNIDSLRDDKKIYAWVYQIARNAIVDYYRKENRPVEFRELTEDLANEPEDDLSVREEIGSCLKVMLENLPEKYKQAIILTEFHNLTQRELSEQMGISLSGAKSRVQRARVMLKEMLLGCCHFKFDRLGNIIDYTRKDCNFVEPEA